MNEAGSDLGAVSGEPQLTAPSPLEEGFLTSLVSEKVGPDKSAVLTSEEDLGRPAGKGRYDDGLPDDGRRLPRAVTATAGPQEPQQRLEKAGDRVRHCRQLRWIGGHAPGLSLAVAGVLCARPTCDIAV